MIIADVFCKSKKAVITGYYCHNYIYKFIFFNLMKHAVQFFSQLYFLIYLPKRNFNHYVRMTHHCFIVLLWTMSIERGYVWKQHFVIKPNLHCLYYHFTIMLLWFLFPQFRREILHSYGFEHMVTLYNLEKAGLFKKQVRLKL